MEEASIGSHDRGSGQGIQLDAHEKANAEETLLERELFTRVRMTVYRR